MTKSHIAELREWFSGIEATLDHWKDRSDEQYCIIEKDTAEKFHKILSRHEAEQGEGLREALVGMVDMYIDLVNSGDAGNWDPEKDKEVIAARLALSRHPTPDKAVEPLAVLAEKHNWPFVYYRKRVNPDDGPYTIELSDGYHIGREFHGPTYAAAEAKARQYLEGIVDKEKINEKN